MIRLAALIVATAVACVAASPSRAQEQRQGTLNLDFETRGFVPDSPAGWLTGGQGYEVKLDEGAARSGKLGLRMTRQGGLPGFGVATGRLPTAPVKGKRVRLSGALRTEGVTGGYAGLWLRVDGPDGKLLGFDNMAVRIHGEKTDEDDRGVRGTTGWKGYAIEVDVDPVAVNINFGALLTGGGTACFDDLRVEVDGKPFEEARKAAGASVVLTPAQLGWLKAHALPFRTTDPGGGFDDLMPLKEAVGDARIVALGEATHGTAEFFKMKDRLTEFLASEMGFTVFAIEASMPEAYRLNDYVLHGKGDPKALLRGMYFWTWNTQEVLDMILRMRAFNSSGKGRIEFLGFDMQEPKVAAENVREFVAKADPGYVKPLDDAYAGLTDYQKLGRSLAPAWTAGGGGKDAGEALKARLEVGKLAGRVTEVLKHLEAEHDALGKVTDPKDVDWAIQNARIVVQAVCVLTGQGVYRDLCMADNVDWILKQHRPGTKIILWAHNGHVAKQNGSMGGFLSRRHGKEMVVAGFAFHEGRYTAVAPGAGLKANEAGPSEPGSVEWAFHQAGLPRAILDLRAADKGTPESAWLTEPLDHRSIGALAMDSAFFPAVLSRQYDLLIYFDTTTASALLPPNRRD